MANSTLPFLQSGLDRAGNSPTVCNFLEQPDPRAGVWIPAFVWQTTLTWEDLRDGLNQTRTATITVPASGFVAGFATVTFSGGPLASPIQVTAVAEHGDDEEALAAALELAIEGESALDDYVTSANATTNTVAVVFVAGVAAITVTLDYTPAQTGTLTFGGTEADGDYVTTFSLFDGGPVVVTTTRSTTPATNNDLATQHATDIEAEAQLAGIVFSATDATVVVTVLFEPVITYDSGQVAVGVSTAAPTGATLAWEDTTPAGPTLTVATTSVVDLNGHALYGFPAKCLREEVMINVTEAFGANRTITIGDAANPDAVLGDTPVTLNSTGEVGSAAACAEHLAQTEAAWVPTATIALGASFSLTAGSVTIYVVHSKYPD